jgi:hypothetical protein
LKRNVSEAKAKLSELEKTVKDTAGETKGAGAEMGDAFGDKTAEKVNVLSSVFNNVKGAVEKLVDSVRNGFKKMSGGIKESESEVDKFKEKVQGADAASADLIDKFGSAFGKFIPENIKKGAAALKELGKSIDLKPAVKDAGAFGSSVVSAMRGGVKSALQFGVALNAATGGLLLVVGAVVGLVAAIAKIAKSQGEFNEKVNASKSAQDALAASVGATTREQESQNRTITETNKLQNAAAVVVKKIGDAIGGVIKPAIDAVRAAWDKFAASVTSVLKWLGLVTDEELEQAARAVEFVENYKKIGDAAADYQKQLLIIEKTETDMERKNQAKLSALNSYIAALAEQSVEMERQDEILEETLTGLKAERDALEAMVAPVKEREKAEISSQEKIAAARMAAEEKYKEAIARANAELATGELTEEDWATQREAAMKRWRDDLQGIVDEYDLIAGAEVDLLNYTRKEVAETEIKKRAALDKAKADVEAARKSQEAEDERAMKAEALSRLREDSIDAEIALNKERAETLQETHEIETKTLSVQQERERTALHANEAYKKATDLERAQMDAVLDTKQAYESQALAAKQAKDAEADLASEGKKAAEAFKEVAGEVAKYAGVAGGAIVSISNSLAEIQRIQIQEQIDFINETLEEQTRAVEDLLNEQLVALSEMRNKALEEAGFIAATSEEGLEAALQAAIETGDEALIYAERRRQEELAINREFDRKEQEARDEAAAREKAAVEKAEAEKAQLEYEAAMTSWENQLLQAGVSIAASILQGFASGGPIIGAALAPISIAVGAVQIAAIKAGKPKPPRGGGGSAGGGVAPDIASSVPVAGGAEPILPSQSTMGSGVSNQVANTGGAAEAARAGNEADGDGDIAIYIDGVAAMTVSRINDGLTRRIYKRMIEE